MVRLLLVLIAIVALTAAPAAAQSLKTSSPISDAAAAVRSGTTVYVHPDARDALSEAEANEIASSIQESGGRTFVAVLPAGAGTGNVAQRIGEQARVNGTYVGRRRRHLERREHRPGLRPGDAAHPGRVAGPRGRCGRDARCVRPVGGRRAAQRR